MDERSLVKARDAIQAYGRARKRFREVQQELAAMGLLRGNDNKVGVAGEFWAIEAYRDRGYEISSPLHTNNKHFDFIANKGEQRFRVSVKAMTPENKLGITTFVHSDGDWDQLCMVLMDDELQPLSIRFATQQEFQTRFSASQSACKKRAERRWLQQEWMRPDP